MIPFVPLTQNRASQYTGSLNACYAVGQTHLNYPHQQLCLEIDDSVGLIIACSNSSFGSESHFSRTSLDKQTAAVVTPAPLEVVRPSRGKAHQSRVPSTHLVKTLGRQLSEVQRMGDVSDVKPLSVHGLCLVVLMRCRKL